MNYIKQEIKKGINFHKVNTNRFKTNLFAIFLTTPLKKESVTENALLPLVLKRGSAIMQTQELICKKLEDMYGASFDCGIDKSGNNHVIKFYLETLNNNMIPTNENIVEEAFKLLFDIIFNPLIINEGFKEQYIDGEKNKLKQIINSKIDNKAKYAMDRCIEEMYKGKPYELYKYGYIEDLNKINGNSLYEYYKKLINDCKIDIFISGDAEDNIIEIIKDSEQIKNLNERDAKYTINGDNEEKNEVEVKLVEEAMDVMQGKLVLGLDVVDVKENEKYAVSVYNIILGGSANSKLFQNVREKASLAYTAGSSYLRQKNNIIIKCGIEIENYEKATEIIKEQLKEMEDGKFTDADIENAKNIIISTVDGIPDSQDSEISYYLGQELTREFVSLHEYIEKIKNVKKEDVEFISKKIKINTIYFLKNDK